MIDPQTKERILNSADIVEVISEFVSLKKRGSNYLGLCPFHNEKTPSFSVSPSKGIYKCFGCGRGGDVVSFIMEYEKLSYPEALRYLARKYNIEVEERELTPDEIRAQKESESLYAVTEFARKFFMDSLYNNLEGISVAQPYFRERGFLQETLKKFDIGYCPGTRDTFTQAALKAGYKKEMLVKAGLSIESDGRLFDRFSGRVMFPIHSLSGKVVGFGGRVMKKTEKTAKYINTPETPIYHKSFIVYGIYQARKAIQKEDRCYLVEGYTDVLSLHQNGIENVVASSGTSLTVEQIRLIKRFTKNITILYDGDAAGVAASLRGIDMVLEEGLNVRVLLLPEGEDPDSFAKKHGADEVKAFIRKNEQDFLHFKTRLLSEEAGHDPVKKAGVIRSIVGSIAVIPDPITRNVYLKECSRQLEVDEEALLSEVAKIRRKRSEKVRIRLRREEEEQNTRRRHTAQVSTQERPGVEVLETEILRLLLQYGSSKKIILGKKPRITEIPVAEYIFRELEADGLVPSDPVLKKIYDEYRELFLAHGKVDHLHFVHHSDESVRDRVVDLLLERYSLSKIWTKHENVPETEEMMLDKVVRKAILSFKEHKVDEVLGELQQSLKQAEKEGDQEKMDELFVRIHQLHNLKKKITLMIGPRTILPRPAGR